MRSSIAHVVLPQNKLRFRGNSAAVLFCLVVFIAFATFSANAQSTIAPTTNTIQFAGTPALSSITAPTGAQVLYGTALNPVTNQPVRHLWVGDATAGLCRIDPDLDSPGPYAINPGACLTGFAILGGAMALDPVNNLLYFVETSAFLKAFSESTIFPPETTAMDLWIGPHSSTWVAARQAAHFRQARRVAISRERSSSPTLPLLILKAISGSASASLR